MAKFDFNRSQFALLFDSKDGMKLLKELVDTSDLFNTNYGWYKTQGKKAQFAIPTSMKGLASFTITDRKIEAAPVMSMRAPLAGAKQMDTQGTAWYTAAIPDFISDAWVETVMERDYRIKQYQQWGDDARLIADYVRYAQVFLDSADATMNWMTAKLISTGKIDYQGMGRGIQAPIHEAKIPVENFHKAGAKVWTAPDCNILSQMAKIEDEYRTKWNYTGALVWKMPKKMFYDVFLQNKEVLELVKNFRTLNYIASTDAMRTTKQMFEEAFVDYQGVSPIEIVEEKERNKSFTKDEFVHGWEQNNVVLCPAGDVVEFEYTDNLDQYMYKNYSNGEVSKVFASVNGGLGTLVNVTEKAGDYNKWSVFNMMSAVPALTMFTHHVIVNTAEAGDN